MIIKLIHLVFFEAFQCSMYIILSLSKLANCYEHTRRKKLRTLKIVRKPFIYLKKKSGHQNFGKMEKKIDWCTAHKLHTENLKHTTRKTTRAHQ